MIQELVTESAEETSEETQGKWVTHCMGMESLKRSKAQTTGTLKEIVKQYIRNSEGSGIGGRAGSCIYDCISKILLERIGKKLCDSRWED